MFLTNLEEKEDLPPLTNIPISNSSDDNYMNIDIISLKQISILIFIMIILTIIPLFLSYLFPKRIIIKAVTINTHQNPYENTQNYSFFITNQNLFNDFYTISCQFFSETNFTFNLYIEKIYKQSFIIMTNKTFFIESNETQLLHSDFLDKSRNIKFTINFLTENSLITNSVIMHIFCEMSSASLKKFHIFIQLISSLFLFFFGHLFDISIERSGFICPEQFVTQLCIYLFVIFNIPVNILRNFFPIPLLRIIEELFQCFQKSSFLIISIWFLYLKIPYQNRIAANVIVIVSGICISIYLLITSFIILFSNIINNSFYFNYNNDISFHLLIFAVFSTFLSCYLTYKNRNETDYIIQTKIYCNLALISSFLLLFTQFFGIIEKKNTTLDLSFHAYQFLHISYILIISILHFPLKRKHRKTSKQNRKLSKENQKSQDHQLIDEQPTDVSLLS